MAVATFGHQDPIARAATQRHEVDAFCDGAASLTQAGNRVAAIALLWTAIGADPAHFVAHRRLAVSLANAGDVAAAGTEYARYIGLVLKRGDVVRAAAELTYARATLGDLSQLRFPGQLLVSLDEVASALARTVPAPEPPPMPAQPAGSPLAAPPKLSRGFAFRPVLPSARPGPAIAAWLLIAAICSALAVSAFR